MAAAAVAIGPTSCSGTKGDDTAKKKPSETAAPAPSRKMSPTKVLAADLNYSNFNRIVVTSGLGKELDAAKKVTLLVPSNAALDTLGAHLVDKLIADPVAAATFVKTRTLGESLNVTDMLNRTEPIKDEAGTVWQAKVVDGRATLSGASLGPMDIPMRNGYLHVLDSPGEPGRSAAGG